MISLDGTDITDKVEKITVTMDRDAPHNKIDIASATPALFALVDPRTAAGTHRITLTVGSQSWNFLLEPPIRGDERNFSFGGRSLSAQEEELYAGRVSVSLFGLNSTQREAETVASGLLTSRSLTWNLSGSMPLPETYSFSGSPIDGVREIAGIFGAIVRSAPDGNLIAEPYYRSDPRSVSSADFSLDALADIADTVGYEETDGLKKNAVIIRSPAEYESPKIEWEGSYEQWDTAYCRVFWDNPEVKTDPDTFATSGSLSKCDPFVTSATYTEDVQFKDGVGSVANAMQSLISCVWQGLDGGTPVWDVGGTELRIAGIGGLATVSYTAKFQRWKLSGMSRETVLIGFGDPITDAVAWDFRLTGATGTNRLDDIEDANIRTLAGGTARALAEILATADKRFLDIEIDMGSRVVTDGMTVNLSGEIMGISGFFHVQKSVLNIEKIASKYSLRIEKWLP